MVIAVEASRVASHRWASALIRPMTASVVPNRPAPRREPPAWPMPKTPPLEPIDRIEPLEPIERIDPDDPIESNDPAEKAEPNDNADPTEPADRTEPIDRNDSSENHERHEWPMPRPYPPIRYRIGGYRIGGGGGAEV
jgi:hypothetical protein